MTDTFPREPGPAPTDEEVRHAREEFALHLPSMFHRLCIAHGCGEEWPCHRWRRAAPVLHRAGEIDADGRWRQR